MTYLRAQCDNTLELTDYAPTELEQLWSDYSDAYKDAYGIRPRGWDQFSTLSLSQARAAVDEIYAAASRAAELASQERQLAEVELKGQIAKMRELGVVNVLAALHDAYGTNGDDEYLEYRLGVNYGHIKSLGL